MKFILYLLYMFPLLAVGADYHAPAPFSEIMARPYSKSWAPQAISSIANRDHILLLDAETKQYCLSVTSGGMLGIEAVNISTLTESSGTYGQVLRAMFQLQDLNIESQATQSFSSTYTIRPELMIYYGLDANATAGSTSSGSILVNRIKGVDLSTFTNPGHLVFTFSGSPSSTKAQVTARYIYDSVSDSLVADSAWSPNHWLKIGESGVELVTSEADGTSLFLASALDLIDFANNPGESFNPTNISWQTNSFAAWPENPGTGEIDVNSITDSHLTGPDGLAYKDIDENYRLQFGSTSEATAVASAYLDQIEAALADAGESLRYSKDLYLTVRQNMLSHTFAAIDEVNAELGQSTVPYVYFTNAQDDNGVYHPFMTVGTRNGTGGPNFLIDVARPPGDGASGTYEEQTITRNAVLSSALFRIPLKDYGLVSSLTDNDLSSHNSLAADAGVSSANYDVYNYSSYSVSGLAVDGVKIYPSYNNTLVFAPVNAEITSTGVHVGRGMGLHYHADGHGFTGNGINLYNIEDYEGHTHPPVIGFGMDGLAIYGKYESNHATMDGASVPLDEYGSHDHDDYGHHYHAFEDEVSSDVKGEAVNFTQHFFMVGAYRGKINDIPGFQDGGTNQLKDAGLGRYVGVKDSYVTTSFDVTDSTPTTYSVSVSASTGGSVTGGGAVEAGSSVSLSANADSWYEFTGWSNGASGNSNPLILTVNQDLSPLASFSQVAVWSDETSLGQDWYSTDWLGIYYKSSFPWVYHQGIGWLYPHLNGADTSWVYMPGRNWLWVSSLYPSYLYEADTGYWLYFEVRSGQPSFYEFSTTNWVAIE